MVRYVTGFCRVPSPLPSNTLSVPSASLDTTTSSFPSPLTSPTATLLGAPETATAGATRNVASAFGLGVAGAWTVEPEDADVWGDWLGADLTDWARIACESPKLQPVKKTT